MYWTRGEIIHGMIVLVAILVATAIGIAGAVLFISGEVT